MVKQIEEYHISRVKELYNEGNNVGEIAALTYLSKHQVGKILQGHKRIENIVKKRVSVLYKWDVLKPLKEKKKK